MRTCTVYEISTGEKLYTPNNNHSPYYTYLKDDIFDKTKILLGEGTLHKFFCDNVNLTYEIITINTFKKYTSLISPEKEVTNVDSKEEITKTVKLDNKIGNKILREIRKLTQNKTNSSPQNKDKIFKRIKNLVNKGKYKKIIDFLKNEFKENLSLYNKKRRKISIPMFDVSLRLIRRGKLYEANKNLLLICKNDPAFALAYFQIGRYYMFNRKNNIPLFSAQIPRKNCEKALKIVEKLLELEPNYGDGLMDIALIYFNQEKYKSCINVCDKVIKLTIQNKLVTHSKVCKKYLGYLPHLSYLYLPADYLALRAQDKKSACFEKLKQNSKR